MPVVKITDLTSYSTPQATDVLPIVDVGNNVTKKIALTSFFTLAPVQSVAGKTGVVTLAKADVGLGSVENTALSTWAGSSNITTLGTISSGTVPAARVSGLAASATTDTTNASNITSGTLSANRLPPVMGPAQMNGLIQESTDSGVTYWNVVSQQDVGTGPNQVPLNQYLGSMAFQNKESVTIDLLNIGNALLRYNTAEARLELNNGSGYQSVLTTTLPVSMLSWNQSTDTYSNSTTSLDVHSRLRRCTLTDAGAVNYYLDADDSTKKAGDWLRIVETQTIQIDYTGVLVESSNTSLRNGVPAWASGTYVKGQRVTYGGYLWECVAATTTTTPAAGSVSSVLDGTDGQVMVEIPCFSVRYSFTGTQHNWSIKRGVHTGDGWQVHKAFLRSNGTYRDFLYVGAYQSTGTSPATTVSGASNRVNATRATFRSAATARGSGWHLWSQYDLAAIQLLIITEFQTMNSQRKLGNGAMNGSVYVVNTGLSNSSGNRSQNATTPSTGANADYVSYRGLENIYGRAWQFTDGFNINNYVAYLTHEYASFADDTATGYTAVGTVPSASGNYQAGIMSLPDVFIPSLIGGSSATYTGDGLWANTGWRVSIAGGDGGNGALVGAFCLYLDIASSYAGSYIGGRLAFGAA